MIRLLSAVLAPESERPLMPFEISCDAECDSATVVDAETSAQAAWRAQDAGWTSRVVAAPAGGTVQADLCPYHSNVPAFLAPTLTSSRGARS